MRPLVILIVPAALLAVVCLGVVGFGMGQEESAPKAAAKSSEKAPAAKPAAAAAAAPAAPAKGNADEEAIRSAVATYVKAYCQGDAKGVAAHFTADAEYVDEEGHILQGRDTIEKSLEESFADEPGSQLEATIDSIRFIGPGAAVEDGAARVTPAGGGAPVNSRYTAVHLKTDGKWLIASIRDQAAGGRQHRDQVKALEWLVGDWVDESPESVMIFTCRFDETGKYLLRDFTVKIAGHDAMHGSQRFGWDPMKRHLRAWTFDSEGGFSEGVWHRDGDTWMLKSSGVNADGDATSATTIFAPVDAHTMTWQALDVVIGNNLLPDIEPVRIVRKPPPAKRAAH